MSKKLTIQRLRNTNFAEIYKDLLLKKDLNYEELKKITTLILLFDNLEGAALHQLSYRMLLLYTFQTNDYNRLYEYSINNGLVPIAQYIYNNILNKDGINSDYGLSLEFNDIYYDLEYRVNDMYYTNQQKQLVDFLKNNKNFSNILIAPTSYGKTGLIIEMIKNNPNNNICVITPTKSLLGQTKKRILNELPTKKIITQPEMYNKESGVICVLTQERLLRLLQENVELKFDLIIVDEAHNLFEKSSKADNRSILLATVLILSYNRNNKLKCNFLTPFIKSPDKLKLEYMDLEVKDFKVEESMKSEMYYFHNIEDQVSTLYDQFIDEFIDIEVSEELTLSKVIQNNSDDKNIIYLNKPVDTVNFAAEFSKSIEPKRSAKIDKVITDISEYIHPDYSLVEYLKHGIIYHNGSVPESIRYYLENVYTEMSEIRYIITTSTLLQGVNIPATKMFILNAKKGRGQFSPSTFKNLIGRICRLSEIFDAKEGDLTYLLPEVHFIKSKYSDSRDKKRNLVDNFKLSVTIEKNIVDKVENPLLEHYPFEDDMKENAKEFVANLNHEIINNYEGNRAQTTVGRLSYENNVRIYNIIQNEKLIEREIENLSTIISVDDLFKTIHKVFFLKITEESEYSRFKRLKQTATIDFYKLLMDWRISKYSYTQMISGMISYWEQQSRDYLAYVGRWGDQKRDGFLEYWTYINRKTPYEKINYAIFRIKEEFDFLDNEIIKYIEILNSMGKLSETIYLTAKYGTEDPEQIYLLDFGISSTLIELLTSKYSEYFSIKNERLVFEPEIINVMEINNENGILINEVKMNTSF